MKITTLKAKVRRWQRRSGLTDWDVKVAIKASPLKYGGKPVLAYTATADQRATITFDEDTINSLDTDALDHLICHELQHIIDDAQEDAFIKYLGGQRGEFYRAWAAANEKACDHRAQMLVNAYRRKRDRH